MHYRQGRHRLLFIRKSIPTKFSTPVINVDPVHDENCLRKKARENLPNNWNNYAKSAAVNDSELATVPVLSFWCQGQGRLIPPALSLLLPLRPLSIHTSFVIVQKQDVGNCSKFLGDLKQSRDTAMEAI